MLVVLMIKAVDCDTWPSCWFPSTAYLHKLAVTAKMAEEYLTQQNTNEQLQRAIDLIMQPAGKDALSSLNNVFR